MKNEEMEEVGFKNDESTEIESEISVNSFESKCSVLRNEPCSGVIGTHAVRASDGSDESPPSTRVGKWTDSDVTLWNG